MKKALTVILLAIISVPALARAPKGFHEGPYFMLQGGTLYYSADNNARTGQQTGRNFEPTIGFNFGWNVTDFLAPELQARYVTDKNDGRREQMASVNMNVVFSLVTEQLTKWKNFKLLPFVQAGPAAQFASVPGDPQAGDGHLFVWGVGVGVGGGAKFLISRYGYFGVLVQSDFLNISEKKQNIAGADRTVIKGGWNIQPSFLGLAGVHF